MQNKDQIKEHMQVVGSDGQPVGMIDRVEDELIKLTKTSNEPDDQHQRFPLNLVQEVKDNKVVLNKTAEEARMQFQGGQDQARTAGQPSSGK
ncbi:MAG: DUF2171 domain-containing protein [Pyrinomonadaceae bacterium]